jgi:6-phosphogluconolactonase
MVAFSANGKWAYSLNSLDNSVSQFNVNGVTGQLTPFVAAVATGNLPISMLVHPTSRWVYVINRTDKTVSQYSVNADGTLSAMASPIMTGGYIPNAGVLDPSGHWLYVSTNFPLNGIYEFSIDQSNGQLALLGTVNTSSVTIKWLNAGPTRAFIYAGGNPAVIQGSVINPTTGLLTSVPAMNLPQASGRSFINFDPTGNWAFTTTTDLALSQYSLSPSTGVLTSQNPSLIFTNGFSAQLLFAQ